MRKTAESAALIAARMSDIDTDTGQIRGLVPGFLLCERSEQRRRMRPLSSKFVVRPWEPDHLRLIAKGLNPLVSGDGGADNDGRPLFLLAAERFPDRREEFLTEVDRIDKAHAAKLVEDRIPPPTPAQQAERQIAIIAEGMARGTAAAAAARQEAEAPQGPSPELPPKHGDAAPRPTRTRE